MFVVAVLPEIGKSLGRVTLVAGDLDLQDGGRVISTQNVKIYRVGYLKTVPARYPAALLETRREMARLIDALDGR